MRSIAKIIFSSIAFLAIVSLINAETGVKFLSDSSEEVNAIWEDYDFYVYTISWSDSYCKTIQTPADCYNRISKLDTKRIFRIHGLWPSFTNGKIPKGNCNTGSYITIPDSDEEPFITMSQIWPSLNQNQEKHFWEHEYNKHGYCYTKRHDIATYKPYFEKAVEMYNQLNIQSLMENSFHAQAGDRIGISYSQLEAKFGQLLGGVFFEFDCRNKNGEQLLNEVRMYFDLDFKRMNGLKYHTNCSKSKDIVFYFENDN